LQYVEVYFSISQRNVPAPNDLASLDEVEECLRRYEELTIRMRRRSTGNLIAPP
jgi:hypothetical protein